MRSIYEQLCGPIIKWCECHYYTDFVVTIRINKRITTQYLEFQGDDITFNWLNDWYEGESDIELLGFLPIDVIRIYNMVEGACNGLLGEESLL